MTALVFIALRHIVVLARAGFSRHANRARARPPADRRGRRDERRSDGATLPRCPRSCTRPSSRGSQPSARRCASSTTRRICYIGGWFYDSDPKGIRINSLYRDRWNGDDTLAIYIDAFNDNQNAKWFGITPARHAVRRAGVGRREHDQRQLGRLLDGEHHRDQRRMVRGGANSVLQPSASRRTPRGRWSWA